MASFSSSGRCQNVKNTMTAVSFLVSCVVPQVPLKWRLFAAALNQLLLRCPNNLWLIRSIWADDVLAVLSPAAYVTFKKNIALHVAFFLLKFKSRQRYPICPWVRGGHEWFHFRNASDSSFPFVLFRVFSMPCLKGWGSSWNAVSILPPPSSSHIILTFLKCQFYLGFGRFLLNERIHLWLESVTLIWAHGPSVAVIVAFWSTLQFNRIWIHQCFCTAALDGSHSRLGLIFISSDIKIAI